MPGPWPKALILTVGKNGRFLLSSSLSGDDGFLGSVESGEKFLAAESDRVATGLIRGVVESTFKIYTPENEEVDLTEAFCRTIANLCQKAYEAGERRALGSR